MILEYSFTHANVIPPTRANPSDAGLDIFFSPMDITEEIELAPGQTCLLQTGLKFGVPHGHMLQIMNRSSVASKRSLLVGACVVDSGYDGEVFVNLHNVGTKIQTIKRGDKIAQAVLIPVVSFRSKILLSLFNILHLTSKLIHLSVNSSLQLRLLTLLNCSLIFSSSCRCLRPFIRCSKIHISN